MYSDQVLRDHVVNFIIAGRDTTAITLTWFTFNMCKHPEVAEKIYQEITRVEQDESSEHSAGLLEDPVERFGELLTFYNVGKLQYLHAALSETLRLFPPVPLVKILLVF